MSSQALALWHHIVENEDAASLDRLLADDVVFHSPVVHTPQQGKVMTRMYLEAALRVLGPGGFHYLREVVGEGEAILEFSSEVDGIQINGVDIIQWNDQDQITEFKVMIRPLKAINMVHQKMGEALQALVKEKQG